MKMKYLLLKALSEWTKWSSMSSITGWLDFFRFVEISLILCSTPFSFIFYPHMLLFPMYTNHVLG